MEIFHIPNEAMHKDVFKTASKIRRKKTRRSFCFVFLREKRQGTQVGSLKALNTRCLEASMELTNLHLCLQLLYQNHISTWCRLHVYVWNYTAFDIIQMNII